MITFTDHFLSLSLFANVLSCVVFAVVSWFHMCHPYDQDPKYNYPDRTLATLIFLGSLSLMVYVLRPSDEEAWIFVKFYFLVLAPFYCGVLISKYFGTVKQWVSWKPRANVLSVPFFLSAIVVWVYAAIPALQWPSRLSGIVTAVLFVEAAISLVFFLISIIKVSRWVLLMSDESYSNVEDFPMAYAIKVNSIAVIYILITWPCLLTNSQVTMALVNWGIVVCNIALLIFKLRPQRLWINNNATATEPQPVQVRNETAPPQQTVEKIVESIRKTIHEEQLFLYPHLSMQDVVDKCGYGRTYVSWVFKNRLGGFFKYVNDLRLAYADNYRKEHPLATLDEVATASGFTTRQSYYRVRQRLKE